MRPSITYAAFERRQARLHLGEHAFADRALLHHAGHVLARQGRHELAVLLLDATDIGEDDELLRAERRGHGAGDQVGVDVVRAPVFADAHRGDDRDGIGGLEVLQDGRVYGLDVADESVVLVLAPGAEVCPKLLGPFGFREGFSFDEPAVLAAQPDGLGPVAADQRRDLLVDGAPEDHLDDFHRGFVGHAHALTELRLDRKPLEHLVDLRPAAVHDDRVEPDVLHQHDVGGEPFFQRRVGHGLAAVLQHDGLAGEGPDVRQGLHQDVRLPDQLVHAIPLARVTSLSSVIASEAKQSLVH